MGSPYKYVFALVGTPQSNTGHWFLFLHQRYGSHKHNDKKAGLQFEWPSSVLILNRWASARKTQRGYGYQYTNYKRTCLSTHLTNTFRKHGHDRFSTVCVNLGFAFRMGVNPGSWWACHTTQILNSQSRFLPFPDMTNSKMLTCVGFNPASTSHEDAQSVCFVHSRYYNALIALLSS